MMTSQHWMNQTKRGILTPRSKKLKVIDDALSGYHLAKQTGRGATPALTKLFDSLIDWIESKGSDWKSSTRNNRIEAGGKGTVETLLNEVVSLNPAFRPKASRFLAQAAPPAPPVMQHGVKNRQKDEDGHWYELPVQNKENSCGPCSVRIVIKLVTNQDVAEDYFRELVEVAEEGGAYAGSLGQGGVLKTAGVHDWSPTGYGTWMVPAVLDAYRPAIATSRSNDPKVLLTTTKKKPAIGVVDWDNGGRHYVVIAGKNNNGDKLIILDPYYGLQTAPVSMAVYEPQDTSGTKLARATWYAWVCKVE